MIVMSVMAVLVISLIIIYNVHKTEQRAIKEYPKMKPIIEKYRGDLNRVIKYSKESEIQNPIIILKKLIKLKVININNSEIEILTPLPVLLK